MNKRDAKEKAQSETLTFGELKAMIASARTRGGMSKVNPQLTLERTCDIFAAAIADRPDDEKPKAWRRDPYSSAGRMKPSRDALIVTNILRDCAP